MCRCLRGDNACHTYFVSFCWTPGFFLLFIVLQCDYETCFGPHHIFSMSRKLFIPQMLTANTKSGICCGGPELERRTLTCPQGIAISFLKGCLENHKNIPWISQKTLQVKMALHDLMSSTGWSRPVTSIQTCCVFAVERHNQSHNDNYMHDEEVYWRQEYIWTLNFRRKMHHEETIKRLTLNRLSLNQSKQM